MGNAKQNLIELLTPVIQNTIDDSEKIYNMFEMIILQGKEIAGALQRIQRKYALTNDAVVVLYRECTLQIMINIVSNLSKK